MIPVSQVNRSRQYAENERNSDLPFNIPDPVGAFLSGNTTFFHAYSPFARILSRINLFA